MHMEAEPQKPSQSQKFLRLALFFFTIALTIYILSIRDTLSELKAYGYPGIFLISLLTNATVIIPLPGVLLTSVFGAVFHPLWVALAAGSGAAIGEFSGYLAGFSGRPVVQRVATRVTKKEDWQESLDWWMKRFGGITIMVLAFIPNPLFDMAGISAGMLKMHPARFLLWCFLGKFLKMLIFAYGGATLFEGFFRLWG